MALSSILYPVAVSAARPLPGARLATDGELEVHVAPEREVVVLPEQAVRATIAVALGDLVVRHPNRLEPWTDRLYSQLRDSDVRVRKNMLMVLTHLILSGLTAGYLMAVQLFQAGRELGLEPSHLINLLVWCLPNS